MRIHLIAVAFFVAIQPAVAGDVPPPAKVLGFAPGDDFHLAPWGKVVDYFHKVDETSDRVLVRELGKTTEGRPYIVAIVSSAETIANIEKYRDLQHKTADPRIASIGVDPAVAGKPVVLITCSIHSVETASTLMAVELLHQLATGDDAKTREILDNTILLLVPSANPDGVEIVANWYEKSKGQPWEGEGLPWLYHKYAGHDTNRDWFMLNLKETQLLTKLLYHEWYPTITYDVHQMGSKGARLFVPPFFDPINPNLDPRVSQGIFLIGAHMAADLAAAGKKGVLTNAMYDNWWNGGNRTTPQRHNMVGVLTEAASVKLASPIFLTGGDLGGATRGFANHQASVNFVDPWQGGWWRLRDIVDYELIAAKSLLTLAARYRVQFQSNYRAMASEAIARGKSEPPYAWIVPVDQRDMGAAVRMLQILRATGVEVQRAKKPFQIGGVSYPAGSWILPAAQPYRAHLKDMMERQKYPDRFSGDGSAETPYDVAGWTLPLQMGVTTATALEPLDVETEAVDVVALPSHGIAGPSDATEYLIPFETNDDILVLNTLLNAGVPVHRGAHGLVVGGDAKVRALLESIAPKVATRIIGRKERSSASTSLPPVLPKRIAVYQPWTTSMDEGWTRLVLENFGFAFTTLHNNDILAGKLHTRFDVIIIASISPSSIREGHAKDSTAPAYAGGLGAEGAEELRKFVREGGRIIGLETACTYLIKEFDLPVKNVLASVPTSQFYGPGSILRATSVEAPKGSSGSAITRGMPAEFSVYFSRSQAFDLTKLEDFRANHPGMRADAQIVARYGKGNPLESGWLLGPEKIQGKGAVASVDYGAGRIVLFAFPPQHRGQTQGTFALLFNAIGYVLEPPAEAATTR